MRFTRLKLALIYVSVSEPFVSPALALVSGPIALVRAPVLVDNDALTQAFRGVRVDLPPVNRVFVALQTEIAGFLKLLIVEFVR